MATTRRALALALLTGGLALLGAPAVLAAADEPVDQIVLSGTVVVPRGEEVDEVVVLHGSVTVEGVVLGDVVVLDGRVSVQGQVSGSVIVLNGPVLLGPDAHVRGDVMARDRVTVKPGATVDGRIGEGTSFTLRAPIRAVGRFGAWFAVTTSTLVLGLLLVLVAPRGADAVFDAARTAPWASLAWGVALALGVPVLSVAAMATLLGLPLGLVVLLALAFVYTLGYAWSAWLVGRLLWRPPRNRALAFLVGLLVVRALALVPFAGGVTWVAGAVYGVGAMGVATWRARGRRGRGRHREGRAQGSVTPA